MFEKKLKIVEKYLENNLKKKFIIANCSSFVSLIIIKFILDLTSFYRRFMRKITDNNQRKSLDENKNLLLCAYLFFCASFSDEIVVILSYHRVY